MTLMDWKTTSAILARLHDPGDQAIWQTFHERFRPPLLSFARKLGLGDEAAEDVAQEALLAFASAYRSGGYDPARGRLSSWLFGIAYRQAALALRKQIREHRRRDARGGHTSFWGAVPAEADASAVWDQEWQQATVQQCLRQLQAEMSDATYRAFYRIVYDNQPPEQVATELNMTRNAVYVAKHRALKRLGELIRQFEAP